MGILRRASAPARFAVTVRRHGDAVVATVSGEVDQATAPHLRAALTDVLRDRPAVVVVDLREVDLLASAGVAALIAAHDQAVPDVRLRVVAPETAPAMKSVQVTGLSDLLVVHPTVDAALTAT
ncbi:STAS domain-containing protein [Actinosynnema sp. NPDC053489]|uniref:STAS domain-containing protein n=1 Tax=Actinosynnema sp. NPDC053489 TaxID=3363916 RepID=UPI0037C81666